MLQTGIRHSLWLAKPVYRCGVYALPKVDVFHQIHRTTTILCVRKDNQVVMAGGEQLIVLS